MPNNSQKIAEIKKRIKKEGPKFFRIIGSTEIALEMFEKVTANDIHVILWNHKKQSFAELIDNIFYLFMYGMNDGEDKEE